MLPPLNAGAFQARVIDDYVAVVLTKFNVGGSGIVAAITWTELDKLLSPMKF